MLEQLREFAQSLASEIKRVYFIAHPAHLPTPEHTLAYAQSGVSAMFDQHLQDLGVWQGPAPVVVFVRDDLPREQLLGVTIHETAHLLPYRERPRAEPANVEIERDAFAYWSAQSTITSDVPNWTVGNHGKEFIRVLLHLWWRAALGGEFVNLGLLFDGPRYDVSPIIFYWQALASEPVKMQRASFDEILATEPPRAFTELWEGDLSRWMNNHPERVKTIMGENN